MFVQEENNVMLKEQEHKHYFIVIKKNNLKFYLSFSDNILKRRKKYNFDSSEMEASHFKLDLKFGYKEKTYEK